MKRFAGIVCLPLLAGATLAYGATVDVDRLDAQIREISKTLRCAVCQTESIWESNAELAKQMRAVVRTRLAQGQTGNEIRAYFVSRYGDYILLKPRKRGLNWILWGGPFLLLATGGGLLYRTLRRWVDQTGETGHEDLPPLDEGTRQRIEQELRTREGHE